MGLLEEARAKQKLTPGPLCTVQQALNSHPKLADDIGALIRDRSLAIVNVARTFRANGIDISDNTIGRHRTNDCNKCHKAGISW